MRRVHAACMAIVLWPAMAVAQEITVQQPVVGVHGAQTSISVPDRGTAFLGGVSRAGASRSSYGPLRSGTSTGMFRDRSSFSVSVQIIDLQAMDEAMLEEARASRRDASPLSGQAGHAYQSLLDRHGRREETLAPVPLRHTDSRRIPSFTRR